MRLRTLFGFFATPVFSFLLCACGAQHAEEQESAPKITPPEAVLHEFYTALDSDDRETAQRLLSEKAKLTDPKGGSLLGNTSSGIKANEGIAAFTVLKVGEEERTMEATGEDGGESEEVEVRTVKVAFELRFNNGESIHSESLLRYELLEKSEDAAEGTPDEFGWRVDAVRRVWEED